MSTPHSRLTITDQIYYQIPEEDPYEISTRVSRNLHTNEQVWSRKCTATDKWELLDLGWLKGKGCSLIVIENHAGTFTQVVPSQTELEVEAKKIIEIKYKDNKQGWLIYPQATERFVPVDSDSLVLRCQQDTTKFTIYAIPL